MDTIQINKTLQHVSSFNGVFPCDLFPNLIKSGTYIINSDTHTDPGSHWLAVYFTKKSHKAFYFDSYGMFPYTPSILNFIKSNTVTWSYNDQQLQSTTSNICGQYVCLFSLYMDMGFTPLEFINIFTSQPDRQAKSLFYHHFGRLR